jgi:hypothetical protein
LQLPAVGGDKTLFQIAAAELYGDVIIVGDKNKVKEAYLVESESGSTYTVREAALNEIYSELDYYYDELISERLLLHIEAEDLQAIKTDLTDCYKKVFGK